MKLAILTVLVISLFCSVASADVLVMPEVTIHPSKYRVCTVENLTQGSGQVRVCKWVTK